MTDTDDVVFHVLRLSAETTRRLINDDDPENHYVDPAGFLVLPIGHFGTSKLSILVDGLYIVDRGALSSDPCPKYAELISSLDALAGRETPRQQMPYIILAEFVDPGDFDPNDVLAPPDPNDVVPISRTRWPT